MHEPQCVTCMFCEDFSHETVRCSNADLAQEGAWEQIYLTQGYLEFPKPGPEDPPCFWFVPRRSGGI